MTKLLVAIIATFFFAFSASAQMKVEPGPNVVASIDLPTDIKFTFVATAVQPGHMPHIELDNASFKKQLKFKPVVFLYSTGMCQLSSNNYGHQFFLTYFVIMDRTVMYSTTVDLRDVVEPAFSKFKDGRCEVVGNKILIKSWK